MINKQASCPEIADDEGQLEQEDSNACILFAEPVDRCLPALNLLRGSECVRVASFSAERQHVVPAHAGVESEQKTSIYKRDVNWPQHLAAFGPDQESWFACSPCEQNLSHFSVSALSPRMHYRIQSRSGHPGHVHYRNGNERRPDH